VRIKTCKYCGLEFEIEGPGNWRYCTGVCRVLGTKMIEQVHRLERTLAKITNTIKGEKSKQPTSKRRIRRRLRELDI